jgi:hypothetical protein
LPIQWWARVMSVIWYGSPVIVWYPSSLWTSASMRPGATIRSRALMISASSRRGLVVICWISLFRIRIFYWNRIEERRIGLLQLWLYLPFNSLLPQSSRTPAWFSSSAYLKNWINSLLSPFYCELWQELQ